MAEAPGELKLGETLQQLLQERGSRETRKEISQLVGVSQGALSQYIHGQAQPRLDVLLRIADYFKVSLDFLVYGRATTQSAEVDYGPLARYLDLSLARVEERANLHTDLVGRLTRALMGQIDTAATELANDAPTFAGMLRDDETLLLEQYSVQTKLISMNLQYDILQMGGGGEAAGRFLPIVAQNLAKGWPYQIALPAGVRDWSEVVDSFRRLLSDAVGRDIVSKHCSFRVADEPVIVGCGLYRLNTEALRREEPIFFERLVDHIDDEDWVGYVIPPSGKLLADALMDQLHLQNARLSFERIWKGGKAR